MGHREIQVDERTWKCLGNFEEETMSSPIPCNISFLKSMNLVNLMLSVPLDFTRIPKKVLLPINYSAVSYLDKIQIQKQCMNSVLNLPDFPCKTKCQPYLFFKSFLPNQVEADTGKVTHDGLLSSW